MLRARLLHTRRALEKKILGAANTLDGVRALSAKVSGTSKTKVV